MCLLYLAGAATALRIVESDDKIRIGNGIKATGDGWPRGEQIGERNGAEVVCQRCADQRGAGVERRGTRDDFHFDIRIGRPAGLKQHFKGRAGHAVDAGITRGNQCDLFALFGAVIGFDGAVEFFGHRLFDDLLAVEQFFDQLDVGGVADHRVGFGNGRAGAAGQVVVAARAKADEHNFSVGCGLGHSGILAMEMVALRPSGPW